MADTLTVELAQHYNGKFAGWQSFDGFPSRDEAVKFAMSHGYTLKDEGIEWLVSIGEDEEDQRDEAYFSRDVYGMR